MIYIKSNEHNIINNYNDKVKMILRSLGFPNALTLENLSYTAKVNEEVKIRQPACQA